MSAKEAEKVRESAGNGAKNVRFDAGVGADEGFLQIRPKRSKRRPPKTGAKVGPDTVVGVGAGEGFRCRRSLKTSKIRPKTVRSAVVAEKVRFFFTKRSKFKPKVRRWFVSSRWMPFC